MARTLTAADWLRRPWVQVVIVGALAWGLGRVAQQQVQAGGLETLRAAARPGDIRMLSSVTCHFCEKAREAMRAQQIPFEECFIERDAACRADYERLGAVGTPTFLIRGQRQLGFDPRRIAAMLTQAQTAGSQ